MAGTPGADGAAVSMVRVRAADGALAPSALAATTCTVCAPSARLDTGVSCQTPAASAVVVPTATPSTYTVMPLPASASPVSGGRFSRVMPSVALAPVSAPGASATLPGAAGGPTLNPSVADGAPALPARSVATILTLCWPSARAAPGW